MLFAQPVVLYFYYQQHQNIHLIDTCWHWFWTAACKHRNPLITTSSHLSSLNVKSKAAETAAAGSTTTENQIQLPN